MTKLLRGIVLADSEDDEYEGMAHVSARDAETGYRFSLSRRVGSDTIQVMVSDQLTYDAEDLSITLLSSGIRARLSTAAASALDGHIEYFIELHSESHEIDSIASALKVIFRGKPGLLLPGTALFVVEDAFQITGRGCVLVPGPPAATGGPVVKVGSPIRLELPDGTVRETNVAGLEMLNYRARPRPAVMTVPILLPRDIRKEDVPPGTKVFLRP